MSSTGREEHKLRGIAAEILRIFCKQQPVLVGTRSIEMSERVSRRMNPAMLVPALPDRSGARETGDSARALPRTKRKSTSALLNTPMEPYIELEGEEGKQSAKRMPPVTLSALKPVFKELGMSDDALDPANMNEIMRIFEVAEGGMELLEDALTHGIPHNILNAKFHEKEAIIIAEAGRKGAVTIATNMAGTRRRHSARRQAHQSGTASG